MKVKSANIRFREGCRVCGNTDLKRILHLSEMPFTDAFVRPSGIGSEFLADIGVFICSACLIAQTQHNVDVSNHCDSPRNLLAANFTGS